MAACAKLHRLKPTVASTRTPQRVVQESEGRVSQPPRHKAELNSDKFKGELQHLLVAPYYSPLASRKVCLQSPSPFSMKLR